MRWLKNRATKGQKKSTALYTYCRSYCTRHASDSLFVWNAHLTFYTGLIKMNSKSLHCFDQFVALCCASKTLQQIEIKNLLKHSKSRKYLNRSKMKNCNNEVNNSRSNMCSILKHHSRTFFVRVQKLFIFFS